MRRIAAGMNHGAAMRHGKARLCRAECPPHFLFVLPKRKRAGHGTKEKTLRGDLTRRCQIIQNGGLAVTNCRPNPEVSYRLRYTYSARNCVPAPESPPHTNVPNRTPPALLSAAAPPSNSGRGFQRGGTAVPPLCATRGHGGRVGPPPRPFVPVGVWGTVASPLFSGGGLRGWDLCAKGPFPLPCSGSYHLREQGKWNVPLWEQREYPLWLLVPETGTALCGSSLYLLNFCFNSYNSPMASMGVRVSGWQRRMASSTSPSLMASSET